MSLLRETPEASLAALRELFEAGGIRMKRPVHVGLDIHCPEITYSADLGNGQEIRMRLYGEGYGRPSTLFEKDVDTTHHMLALAVFDTEQKRRGENDGFLFGAWIVDDEGQLRMGDAPKESDVVLTDGPALDFMRSLREQANKARYKSFDPTFEPPAAGPRP